MMCDVCQGSCVIYRPVTVEYGNVIYHDADGKQVTKTVRDLSGGVDACPRCAALAWAHWEAAIAD